MWTAQFVSNIGSLLAVPAGALGDLVERDVTESFCDGGPLIGASTLEVGRNGRLIMTIAIYLIAAAVVICGCIFFMRARSRD